MPRRKPPSRIRYEQRNPTISCRVPAEFKEELNAHLQMTGQSLSEWIQDAFAGREDRVKDIEEMHRRAMTEGALGMLDTLKMLQRMGKQTK